MSARLLLALAVALLVAGRAHGAHGSADREPSPLLRKHAALAASGVLAATSTSGGSASAGSGSLGRRSRAARASRRLKLVGGDDRVEVTPSSGLRPWSAVGLLAIANGSELLGTCTGTLIARNAVLTAGHCVYDSKNRALVDTIEFYPNLRGPNTSSPVRASHWETAFSLAGQPVPCSSGSGASQAGEGMCLPLAEYIYDVAVVILEEDIGAEYGWFGFAYSCEYTSYRVATAGYPGDLQAQKPGEPLRPESRRMYATAGILDAFSGCVNTLENNIVSSTVDTAPGQSGSSLWDASYTVRAIHSSGLGARPYHRTINAPIYQFIVSVLAEYATPYAGTGDEDTDNPGKDGTETSSEESSSEADEVIEGADRESIATGGGHA